MKKPMDDLKCFWCVVDRVEKQEFHPTREVVTLFEGTPVCSIHAKEIAGRKERWYQQVIQVGRDAREKAELGLEILGRSSKNN